MEVKNYNFVYQNVEDLEKIDDNESVKDDDESTEDNKSDIDYNRKPKKYKIRNSRKINRLTKTIDEAGRKIIIDHMDEWLKRGRKPIDRSSFSPEEEHYICELVVEYQRTNNGPIPWKDIQPKVKAKFGKFRSRNSIKNVWYAGQRRNDRLAIFERNEFNTIKDKFEIEDKDKIEYYNEIEDKSLIDNNVEIEDKGEIKYENEFEGVPEKLHQLAFSVNKIEPSTNQEKLKFRYLLNDDENDNDIL
ncbi:hypothetical protein RhiirA1_446083 [Rhizophagus irregularis]|uniref:Myb-like domain-containing protein n=1 Tax=Rhizophagus irregularis TaxID=588596 RepID=A0A2N0R322_9GLOM|nr:hypothetical protein RhiirA1_446083 [Rhizophagus irregularis]